MNKQNKGITLIALVITIVILVILVGVSVSVAINTGLITNTKTAVANYGKAQTQEELEMEKLAGMVDIYSMKEVKAGEYTGTSNKKYVDGGKTAYIPAGFTVSNVEGETTINGGLVIYSNKSNSSTITDTAEGYMAKIKSGETGYTVATLQATYNQYVWIPVENPSDMYGTITEADVELNPDQGLVVGEKYGKLYFKTNTDPTTHYNWPSEVGYSNTSYREPAYLANNSEADDSEYNLDANGNKIITENGIKSKFNKMINSVETYKGFYIGRYELTGTVNNPTVVKGATPLTADASYSVNDKLNWYGLYTMCEKLEQNNTDAQGKVTTSMIWGSQWDQAVKKSLDDKSDFLTNAGKYGVYDVSSVAISGTKVSAYNIFDMSGNVWDWTLEAYDISFRVIRGGSYLNYTTSTTDRRFNKNPNDVDSDFGCRAQLYL